MDSRKKIKKNRRRLVEDYIKSKNGARDYRVGREKLREERNDKSRCIFEQDKGIKVFLFLTELNNLNASNIDKVTELERGAAQMMAHINYIGSSQTKRTLSTLNIQSHQTFPLTHL